MTDIQTYTERVEIQGLPTLGSVAWYAISESGGIDHATFVDLAQTNGITDAVPSPPRSSDIFKRACTSVQRTRIPTSDPDRFVNLLSRRVGHDADNIWRALVEEVVDTQGHTLEYTEIYRLHYIRSTEEIISTELTFPSLEARNAALGVQQYFDAWANKLTAYTVREWVRGRLRALSATVLRDGVYFVKVDHAERLRALENLVNGLPGSLFHSLPLIDDSRQRDMLKSAFEAESIYEVDRLLVEVREMMEADRPITRNRAIDFKLQADRIRERVAEYADLLDTAMDSTAARLDVLQMAWENVLERTDLG